MHTKVHMGTECAPSVGWPNDEPITMLGYIHWKAYTGNIIVRIQRDRVEYRVKSGRINPMANHKSVAVVGGGLVGPLQALFLAQAGFEVHVYDKRSDLRATSEFLQDI